jgi:hypothetical protein
MQRDACKQRKAIKEGIATALSDWDEFRAFAQRYGDKTQAEMVQLWQFKISKRTMSRALARIGWTRKKNLWLPRTG